MHAKVSTHILERIIHMLDIYKANKVTMNAHDDSDMPQLVTGKLYQSLVEWSRRKPQAACIVEADSEISYSYAQVLTAVNAMRSVLGDKPQRIVMSLPGGILNAIIWISALSGGHHLLPVAPEASEKEKARAINKHRPDIVIIEQEQAAEQFAPTQARFISAKQCAILCEQVAEQSQENRPPVEGMVYLATSGTTGEPKGVILRESQIAWTAEQVCISHQLNEYDRGLTVLPFSHVNAPVVSLCATLLAGSTVVIARRFSRSNFWSWIERYQITWASIVPTIVTMLLTTDKPDFLPGTLRFLRTGSASLPATDLRAFEAKFALPVLETYGLSEAASQIVANPLPPAAHKPGSAGIPVGITLRICALPGEDGSRNLQALPNGQTGEICVSGPPVIAGYQDNAGSDAFLDGWFLTGDLGYLDEDGYVFITGRLREVIIRGGENIAPREIEEVLMQHPAIREAAAVGRPDALYGEQVVAYVATHEPWNSALKSDLQHFAAQHLSAYKVPVDFIPLDALPRNHTGKIERHLLRTREQEALQHR
jgi:acyl-CoA synthetase (AMP-forming)/AMP-acid ligase II